jgi:hypothetical protein
MTPALFLYVRAIPSAREVNQNGSQPCKEIEPRDVWSPNDQSFDIPLGDQVTATDMMGNAIRQNTLEVGSTPLYLTSPNADSLRRMLLKQGTARETDG